ncbi:uncharacterized protein [Watersipora subatra]|uniref:uncharacterized protein n=1 Tax=Watersipora subatra TaxID=2589382 RepID=UPI00355C4C36
MLQSTLSSTERRASPVAESSTALPLIAVDKKPSQVLQPKASVKERKHQLPPIIEKAGEQMDCSGSSSDLRVVVYESLEQRRANKIGVKPLRNFDVTRSRKLETMSASHSFPPILTASSSPTAPHLQPMQADSVELGLRRGNTIAPFTTLAPKPTCGYYFNRETLNKKVRIGVPPSDLVKWRTDYSLFPQPQKQT